MVDTCANAVYLLYLRYKVKVMDVVIYARVSTQGQEYDRQINELTACADRNMWTVRRVFAEKVSGVKKNTERPALEEMISYVKEHSISKVLVLELSRLGRDTLEVLKAIETMNSEGISVYIHNYHIETLTDKGEVNAISQFLITILAEVARMERKTIRERIASGYCNYRAKGGKVGRKIGYRKSATQMKEEYSEVIDMLKCGHSISHISKTTGVSPNTIRKCRLLI